jgi:hypothetical protein
MSIAAHLELSRLRIDTHDLSAAIHWFLSDLARDAADLLNSFGERT